MTALEVKNRGDRFFKKGRFTFDPRIVWRGGPSDGKNGKNGEKTRCNLANFPILYKIK